jgi:DNA replication protein DnaC
MKSDETIIQELNTQAENGVAEITAEEREENWRKFSDAARTESAKQRFLASCPPQMLESDWQHPALMPFLAQLRLILGHSAEDKGILASGPTGRGKTRAMWALMRRYACDEGLEVRCWSSVDWFSALLQQVRYGRDEARDWVEATAARKIVFLDDYGQEAMQLCREDWARAWFFRFLDLRVGAGLPLYVTTNLGADEMAERSGNLRGDPLIRRLLDLCDPIRFETAQEIERAKMRGRK